MSYLADRPRIFMALLVVLTIALGIAVTLSMQSSCEERGGTYRSGYTSAGYAFYCDEP